MREIAVLSFISLDGVAQGPVQPDEDTSNGFTQSGWAAEYFADAMELVNAELMETPVSFLFGRKTYEMFAPFWQGSDEAHADLFTRSSKFVVSSSLKTADWQNSEIFDGDTIAKLKRIKAEDGPRLQVHGSIDLIQTLLAHDLVDEIRLLTFPVVVGSGHRLFGDKTMPMSLTLVKSKVIKNGVTMAVYRRT